MKILITGCCGFIGSHLTEYLSRHYDHEILGIDNMTEDESNRKEENLAILHQLDRFQFEKADICNTPSIERWRPDIVVHLAGLAGVRNSIACPEKYIYNNVFGHSYLLKESIKYHVKKFIYASSSSVYGSNVKKPFKEEDPIRDLKSPYALSKWTCEKMSEIYSKNSNSTEIIGCRFFSVYGPRGRPDMAPLKFLQKIKNDQVIEVNGDGFQERDFTYIDDVIQCLSKIIHSGHTFDLILNVGYGQPIKILMLISILEELLQKKARVRFLPGNELDAPITHCDTKKLIYSLDYIPHVNIKMGLQKMIDYYDA